ncbi:hypothetical protein FGO68_gene10040 [Halteria grandinella]|uniref:Protein kinase domain-containing protein n=1 Tax=Halteria grandinella TaxID=5974 RepID=A0A8J8NEE1_HALGN|nr:hypothetical protein FGO68_gene10040 [Halteria grandinella]
MGTPLFIVKSQFKKWIGQEQKIKIGSNIPLENPYQVLLKLNAYSQQELQQYHQKISLGKFLLEFLASSKQQLDLTMFVCYHILKAKDSSPSIYRYRFSNYWTEYKGSLRFAISEEWSEDYLDEANFQIQPPKVVRKCNVRGAEENYSIGMMLFIVITGGLMPYEDQKNFNYNKALFIANPGLFAEKMANLLIKGKNRYPNEDRKLLVQILTHVCQCINIDPAKREAPSLKLFSSVAERNDLELAMLDIYERAKQLKLLAYQYSH